MRTGEGRGGGGGGGKVQRESLPGEVPRGEKIAIKSENINATLCLNRLNALLSYICERPPSFFDLQFLDLY